MKNGKRIGLSLSGGGYRATIYHLGTLKKLREMNILDKVDVISTISGGSIIGAYFGLHKGNFKDFEKGLRQIVKRNIIRDIVVSRQFLAIAIFIFLDIALLIFFLFTSYAWLSTLILLVSLYSIVTYQYKIFPVSAIISSLYDKHFFHGNTLKDLIDYPVIAINATNLETGRQFTFSKSKMSDSAYEYPIDKSKPIKFKQEDFPLSLAVASSTCVPFAFTPINIERKYYQDEMDFERIRPSLVDGGVYDNQGIHKITQENSSYECDIIIVSDAGNMMPRFSTFNNVIQLLVRTSDIFMNRIKNYQMIQNVFENYRFKKKEIAYQSLGWDFENCINGFMESLRNGTILNDVIKGHRIRDDELVDQKWHEIQRKIEKQIKYEQLKKNRPNSEELKIARSVSTNLKPLGEDQINALIKQAECLTEIQIKLYSPELND